MIGFCAQMHCLSEHWLVFNVGEYSFLNTRKFQTIHRVKNMSGFQIFWNMQHTMHQAFEPTFLFLFIAQRSAQENFGRRTCTAHQGNALLVYWERAAVAVAKIPRGIPSPSRILYQIDAESGGLRCSHPNHTPCIQSVSSRPARRVRLFGANPLQGSLRERADSERAPRWVLWVLLPATQESHEFK